MNKKGFTLTEILGVITIVSLLLLLIIPSITNKIAQNSDKAKNAENNLIYVAVDNYIEKKEHINNSTYCIPIKELIDEGELVEPIVDVETGEDISDKIVTVTIDKDGNKNYDISDENKCVVTTNIE